MMALVQLGACVFAALLIGSSLALFEARQVTHARPIGATLTMLAAPGSIATVSVALIGSLLGASP